MPEVFVGSNLNPADLREIWLVGPAKEAGQALGLVLEGSGALQMFEPLVKRFIEAYHHGGRGSESRIDDGALCVEVLRNGVFEFAVTPAEVFSKNLRSTASDPPDTGVSEALCCFGKRDAGMVRKIHELCDRERIKLEPIAVPFANRAEQVAVVVQWKVRVESTVECGQISAKREKFIELRKDRLPGQNIASFLSGQPIKRTIVALSYADIRVVDNPHYHVGAAFRWNKAIAHRRGQLAKLVIRGVLPQPPRFFHVYTSAARNGIVNQLNVRFARHFSIVRR